MKNASSIDRSKLAIVSCVLAVVSFLGVHIYSNAMLHGISVDLTEERLFTLSDGTREILQDIDEPITVRLFVSKRLTELNPSHAVYADRVRELLERYVDLSDGQVRFELYNPEAFTDEEDLAVAYGMQAVPLDNTGELGYYGIAATNSIDDLETIPYLSPERESFLEYDLTKLIFKLAQDQQPILGVLAGLPIAGGPNQPGWAVMDQIREFFEIRIITPTESVIPEDVDTLLVVHPRALNPKLTYAIDQFVLGGGNALVFVDPNSEIDVAMARGQGDVGRSDFDTILNAWGVELVDGKVLGDLGAARRVNVNLQGQVATADYVVWLSYLPQNLSSEDTITADLQRLTFATPGVLKPIADKGTTLSPLVSSTPQSMEIDVAQIRTSPDVVGLFRDFEPSNEVKTIAARIVGRPSSAFPDGPPPPPEGTAADPELQSREHLAEATNDVNVIVVSDVDMLHEQFWMQSRQLFGQNFSVPFSNNADFAVNAIENMSGGTALMSLRARSEAFRPFTYVERVRQDAERLFRDKETELEAQLAEIQGELANLLNREQAAGELIISPEDRARAEEYRREMVQLRRELRDVQFELRKDIETLDATLKFVNIAAIPLLLGLIALIWLIVGRVRRARRYQVQEA